MLHNLIHYKAKPKKMEEAKKARDIARAEKYEAVCVSLTTKRPFYGAIAFSSSTSSTSVRPLNGVATTPISR